MAISKDRFAKILEQLDFSYSFDDGFCFVLERNGLEIKYFFEVHEEDNLIIAKAVCRTKIDANKYISDFNKAINKFDIDLSNKDSLKRLKFMEKVILCLLLKIRIIINLVDI